MCDVNPDKLDAEEQMVGRKRNLLHSTCMKCKEAKAVVVVRVGDPLCRTCFLTYVTHKFRSTLGKSKLVQANDRVLLALSGGNSSTALVHLVRGALSEGAHKRLRFSPGIVCIDESVTLPNSVEQDYTHIKELSETFGYPFYLVPIYKDFSLKGASASGDADDTNRQQFIKCFESIKTLTGKQDFLVMQRTFLINNTAYEYEYKKVMFGDTSTSLSMKLLCNISLGRGSSIPLDIGVSDDRYQNVTIIRPMRELSSKEVAIFDRLSEINVKSPTNIVTTKSNSSSLQQKTEEFIIGLQTDFPHTVNTVFRTGDKICKNEKFDKCSEKCVICLSPLMETDTHQMLANEFNGKNSVEEDKGCCGSSDECASNCFTITEEEMKLQLCYGCNLTFKDMNYDLEILPQQILDNASAQLKRQKMKESIQDFLLE